MHNRIHNCVFVTFLCWTYATAWIVPVPKQHFVTATSQLHATTTTKLESGQVLVPSYESPNRFDATCVANPVVLPPSNDNELWQMYYYGNAGCWSNGQPGFLPTGWCGLAESEDGIEWTKVEGPLEDSAILGPSDDPDAWDSLHIGVGDVVRLPSGELHMFYLGGSDESVSLGPAGEIAGIRMKIGRAISTDDGRSWERQGVCLDIDDEEGLFCSWPRILVCENMDEWKMLYHAFDGQKWRVFGAKSTDKGQTWTRTGLLLQDSPNSFDSSGIGTRAVTEWRGGWLMVYEGVDSKGTHRLGAAVSEDDGDSWNKLESIPGCDQSGGPIAEPGVGAMGAWTSTVVGTPYLINMPDGSLRMYHVARSGDHGHSIGCVVSETGDIAPTSWKPLTKE